jgi:4-amino-4-deoxy-L-arabinose transferase-like glycosyltransferase
LGIGSVLLFTVLLGARDLWNPNEPLYGRAVVEMERDGAWLVPTVSGALFDEKPILYFWLARISARLLGGVDEFSLRLPSALSGVAAVSMVYLLVLPYAGRRRAGIAGALFATTYVVFWSARQVQMDLLLAACTLGAVLAATRVLDHRLAARTGWTLVGLATGLGLLAKGPVGLICPAIVLSLYAASTRRSGELLRGLPMAGAVAIVIAGPWYLLLWLGGESRFLVELLQRQNLVRFFAPWDHAAPWWYFLAYFWADMAPWSFFVPIAASLPGRGVAARRLDRLAWLWIAGTIVFFSFSASKRSAYILPAAPAVAILVSGLAERMLEAGLEPLRRRALRSVLALLGAILVAAGVVVRWIAVERYPLVGIAADAAALLLVAGGLAVIVGLVAKRAAVAAPAALFALTVSLYLLAAVWLLPAADIYKSARPFCEAVNARVGSDDPLYAFTAWKWRAAYAYYTNRDISRLETMEELAAYWRRPERVFLIVERSEEERFFRVVGQAEPLVARPIGSNYASLFSNR